MFCEGDSNYKYTELLAADELPNVVQTADGRMFSVEYLSLENGEVNAHSQEFPFFRSIHNECVDKGVGFLMFQASQLQRYRIWIVVISLTHIVEMDKVQ